MTGLPRTMTVVDSHTEGEPTRVVMGGWPPLEAGTMEGRREELARRHGDLRRAVVLDLDVVVLWSEDILIPARRRPRAVEVATQQ